MAPACAAEGPGPVLLVALSQLWSLGLLKAVSAAREKPREAELQRLRAPCCVLPSPPSFFV